MTFIPYFHQYKSLCGKFYKRPQIMHCFNHLEINVQCVHKIHGSIDIFHGIQVSHLYRYLFIHISGFMHCKSFKIPLY
jgi:hypothetical protein